MQVRPAAVAGTWYPGSRGALTREVDAYVEAVPELAPFDVQAIIAPHAGIMFSGPVAAYAYKAAAAAAPYDVIVLVGPSHFSAFEGVAVFPGGSFETPLGLSRIDAASVEVLAARSGISTLTAPHAREHSLEMQLPFVCRLLPGVPIVPMLMGFQRRETILELAGSLAVAFAGRRALLVASTDLSHYFDAATAASLDRRVQERVAALDPEGLLELIEGYPEDERGRFVACGAGPAVAVMMAARRLGATEGRVLEYAHSGQISGDNAAVVGYLAAALGKPPS
jgi:AmmeMemoRadiSam system protein B